MSRRRVGGEIKKGKGAKIALREEELEEKVDEDVEDTKKAKEPVKTKPIAKKRGKLSQPASLRQYSRTTNRHQGSGIV